MNVGFIGIGRMGAGMAANLLKAGHRVTVYNRTPGKARSLIAQGAHVAHSIGEACQGDAANTMLADDEAGQQFIAAPVFGRPDAAAAGTLFVVTGGRTIAVEKARPLLEAFSQQIFPISDAPEAANLVKLSGNFLIASVIESLGEALALIAKAGVDPHQYIDLLTSTLFSAAVYKTYGNLLADRKFEPAGFAAPLGHKDIHLALAAAEELRAGRPLGARSGPNDSTVGCTPSCPIATDRRDRGMAYR